MVPNGEKRMATEFVSLIFTRWASLRLVQYPGFNLNLIVILRVLPALYTSLFKKKLLSLKPPAFIGLDNYIYLLSSPDFWNSIRATIVFTLGTFIPIVIFSLIFAQFIVTRKRLQKFFQMAFYSPAVLSSVVVAAIWLIIFDPRGISNQLVNFVMDTPGVDHKWLANSTMVQISTMLVYFWKYVGYFTIIFIVGLASIPQSIYEAAKIDGTNAWSGFWYITLPLLKPTTILVSIMSMLQCLKTFSTQYLFTQGGAPIEPINVITLNLSHRDSRSPHRSGKRHEHHFVWYHALVYMVAIQSVTIRRNQLLIKDIPCDHL